MAGGEPIVKGKPAIRQMVEGSLKNPGFEISWEPDSARVSAGGDMGYLVEHSKITMTDSTGKTVTHKYKGLTVWQKQADGTWKNKVDVMSPEPEEK
jgi:ketosteroid isomerase-like protein